MTDKKLVKEDACAMSVGSSGPAVQVTDPTTNYACTKKNLKKKILRRSQPPSKGQ